MKTTQWIGCMTVMTLALSAARAQEPAANAPGAPAETQMEMPANISPAAAEVIRLATSGVGDEVVLAYIQNSQASFSLSAENVLYLKDIGLSSQVTSAMINHDGTLRNQPGQYAPAPAQPAAVPAPAPTNPAMAPAPAPGPAPTVETAPAPAYVATAPADVTYFYNDLTPYGTWVYLEGYGWCWQPRTVVLTPGWRPYLDGGNWVYTDAGWYWQSSYSWGWAPFHYGRWHLHPHSGWVWMPDRVWGPAWVTWRVAGDSCGWAPLPPHAVFDVHGGWRYNGVSVSASFGFNLGANAFAFVSFGDFGSRDLHHHALPPARVNNVYKQTTIVNNYTVNNNVVVNRGVPIERVNSASHVAVPRATVREWRSAPDRMPTRNASVVYRPRLQDTARPAPVAAQRVDDRHPTIQHAPIVPARAGQPTQVGGSPASPAGGSRRPAMQSPKYSSWTRTSPTAPAQAAQPAQVPRQPSSGMQTPKSTHEWSSPTPVTPRQNPTPPRSVSPAPMAPTAPAVPRSPDNSRRDNQHKPGDRSDAGTPAINHSQSAAPAPAVASRGASGTRTAPARPTKGSDQSVHSRSSAAPTPVHGNSNPTLGQQSEGRSHSKS